MQLVEVLEHPWVDHLQVLQEALVVVVKETCLLVTQSDPQEVQEPLDKVTLAVLEETVAVILLQAAAVVVLVRQELLLQAML
jgi:hypothetical protein